MVGRSQELGRLRSLLDDACAGNGRVVICTGEAGIGKTRLAEELAASASASGITVAWARATDRGSSPPYDLWKLLLDQLPTSSSSDQLDLWADLLGSRADSLSGGPEATGSTRFELFAQLSQRLTDVAGETGLLVVLDDLQWADEASTALLVELAAQLRGTRLLVVATYRDPSLANEASRTALLPLSVDAGSERLDLSTLAAPDIAELLHAFGLTASPEQVGTVRAQTGGNPFLVREVARVLAADPGTPERPTPVPGRVLEATTYRLSQLSEPAQRLMRAAGVAGNGFSAGVVARMLDLPTLAVLEPLDECRRAGFLVQGDRPGDHRFSHALVRSAVVARLPAQEERDLHTAAADAIEGLYAGQLRTHLAEIAQHRVKASLPGDRRAAVTACEAAADVAADALAFEEAARLYRQALSVGGEEIKTEDRACLEIGLAAALYGLGDLDSWHRAAADVGQQAERRRDHVTLARVALVLEATGEPGWDAEMCRICEAAVAGDLPPDLAVRVYSRLARALVYRNRLEQAGEVSQQALTRAEALGDPAVVVEALHARQLARSGPDGVADRVELAERMLELAPRVGSAWVELWGRLWRIDTLFETGRLSGVQRELVDLENCVQRIAGPLGRWHLLETSATLDLATGRYAEASRCAREAFALASNMSMPARFGGCAAVLGQVGMHIGFDASGMTEHFEQLPARFEPQAADTTAAASSVFPALSVAMMCLQRGDHGGAEHAYALAGPVESWSPVVAMSLSCWAHGLLVAIGLGRTADIEYLARQFEPFRGLHVANGGGAGIYMGPVELQLGKAAAALGRLDEADEDLETAMALCRSNGARGYVVEASVELAGVLVKRQATGDAERAATLLKEASEESDRLGMVVFTERIRAIRADAPSQAPATPLSRRELEVASLVRKGLTNKQIAALLFISERTAENHVQHILAKLGFANRAQIAAWASDLGAAAERA
jgi:DNA-binding CsgD family transcriptional regulator